eukprot:5281721-Prymnesium_polylepis.1
MRRLLFLPGKHFHIHVRIRSCARSKRSPSTNITPIARRYLIRPQRLHRHGPRSHVHKERRGSSERRRPIVDGTHQCKNGTIKQPELDGTPVTGDTPNVWCPSDGRHDVAACVPRKATG